ncbi:hypothetical protein C922_01727 [Plasmodium inui San Antonio 1]|uniref:Uncharacterized protein n=1 Tax=Plasmodium inui San Antonio 1 TaxID=1237626 RepID=W7A8X1_9APIC|nr:hypothetical protein C922_01727 [Plasmodium inui San Antonio 1]EUD68115.1 hypothetical protein C922_01727 [Plasmodium inui San Antonio 1]
MESLEQILRQYEETKRELLHRSGAHKNNGETKAPRGKKDYIEKTVLHCLHRVISSYCSLVLVHREERHSHGRNKGEGGPKKGDKRRKIKSSCKNRWNDGAAHDELARRVTQKKAIQRTHIARVTRFVKTDRSIGTFGKYVERVFRLRKRRTCDGETEEVDRSAAGEIHTEEVLHTEEVHRIGNPPRDRYKRLPKRRIQIILEKDIHFDLFLGAVLNFLQVLLHRKCHHQYCQANCVKDKPPCGSNLTKENKKNWWSSVLRDGGRSKELREYTADVKRLPAQTERVTHFTENPHRRSSSSMNSVLHGGKKHESKSNGEERERRNRSDPFRDSPSEVNSPLHPIDMKMQLWSFLLDGNHHPYNSIIREVDPTLLYIIDSDRSLLRILFFFNMMHLFVTYMYVTICRNEPPLFSCISVFVAIIRSFHGTFKLASNGATEWKQAYAFFCAFASMLRRDILPPAMGGSDRSGQRGGSGRGGRSGGDIEEGSQEEEDIPEGNTLRGMHNQGRGKSHLVHSFGGLCFGAGRACSPGSDARRGTPPLEEGLLNSQAHGKGKSKNEQIGVPPDGRYCYYATVKNDDEIDSVNLAIHVTNTSKDNICFYKRYIEEHIQRGFLRVYKLSEPRKGISSGEKNKEEGISDPSMFKNYRQLFRNFFQEIVS